MPPHPLQFLSPPFQTSSPPPALPWKFSRPSPSNPLKQFHFAPRPSLHRKAHKKDEPKPGNQPHPQTPRLSRCPQTHANGVDPLQWNRATEKTYADFLLDQCLPQTFQKSSRRPGRVSSLNYWEFVHRWKPPLLRGLQVHKYLKHVPATVHRSTICRTYRSRWKPFPDCS